MDIYIYIVIRKGMYGLPQTGMLANELLQKCLKLHGYAPTKHKPGLCKNETRSTIFTFVVDDFGVKYIDKNNVEHLITALKKNYEITIDWEGKRYCGMKLDWDYMN